MLVVVVLEEIETKTGGRLDTLDVTDDVVRVVRTSGITQGTALVFSPHTTCSILIALPGPETASALADAMKTIAPENDYYAHDDLDVRTENLMDNEPANAPAHIFHVLAGRVSEAISVTEGKIMLGDDRRVLFVELDSSRPRRYCIQVVGE